MAAEDDEPDLILTKSDANFWNRLYKFNKKWITNNEIGYKISRVKNV